MLQHPIRMHALSLAGGALLLGGATMAAGAMPLPGSLGAVTEQATAAIVTDGADAAKVEQVWWRGCGWRGCGWRRGWGWHRGYYRGWGWGGYGWRGRWCYWHPYACRGW